MPRGSQSLTTTGFSPFLALPDPTMCLKLVKSLSLPGFFLSHRLPVTLVPCPQPTSIHLGGCTPACYTFCAGSSGILCSLTAQCLTGAKLHLFPFHQTSAVSNCSGRQAHHHISVGLCGDADAQDLLLICNLG